MNVKLTTEIDDHVIISLDITKEEAVNLSEQDMRRLFADIREICKVDEIIKEKKKAEPGSDAEKVHEQEKVRPFVCKGYKGIKPDNPRGNKEVVTDRILDKIIELNEFVIPDSLKDEIEYVYNGTIQGIKYQNMFGGPSAMAEIDHEGIHASVEEDVTRDYKVDLIVKSIIEQENITTTLEERRIRAEEIAEKDDTTIEMIQKFMGEDFALIEHDILVEKVRDLIFDNAVL